MTHSSLCCGDAFLEVQFYLLYLTKFRVCSLDLLLSAGNSRICALFATLRCVVPAVRRFSATKAVANLSCKIALPLYKRPFESNSARVIGARAFIQKTSALDFKLFNLFFLFNYSQYSSRFRRNFNFELFYVCGSTKEVVVIDAQKFLARWKDAFDLLLNVFFYEFKTLVFGSPVFKNEILSLNWLKGYFDINLWRYYFPFFTFRLNNYNKKTEFFFDKMCDLGVSFYIVSDCYYHFKNLHYARKSGCYTIGLVGVDSDPWLVSYPIVGFFESTVTQLFFFRLLNFINRLALSRKYAFRKDYWIKAVASLL